MDVDSVDVGSVDVDACVVWLDGRGLDTSFVGGKASALDRLIGLGARVPASAVLTTAAYRCVTADGTLARAIERLRQRGVPPADGLERDRSAVDQLFLDAPLPDEVVAAIDEIATRHTGRRLAVRSSATAEDLGSASFAGQYRSTLDVRPDDLERAVRLTWASLWHPGPRSYRAMRGIDDREIAMAVLVMDMVEASRAGVLFTRDPTGSPDDVRVEAVHGPGELLVSGEATPDATVLPRRRAAGALHPTDPPIAELVELGFRLEQVWDAPLDIEWAIDDDECLWTLQARPITTSPQSGEPGAQEDDGFDTPVADGAALTTAGIDEMVPGVLPPLVWDTVSWLLEEGFRRLLAGLGAPLGHLDAPSALIARVHGRAAMHLDHLGAAADAIPGGSRHELERRYFGDVTDERVTDERSPGPRRDRRASTRQGLRILQDRHRWALESEVSIRAVRSVLDDEPDPRRLSDAEIVAYRARLVDLAVRTTAAEIAIAAYAASAYHGVEALLARRVPSQAAVLAQRLISPNGPDGRGSGETTSVIAEAVDRRPELPDRSELSTYDWPTARQRIVDAGGSDVIGAWEDALRRAGSRAVFGGPTWETAPELAWLATRAHWRRASARPPAEDPVDVDPHVDLDEVVSGIRWPHRHFVQREIADASELLARRERTKRTMLVLGGIVRRVDDEAGRRLRERGALESNDDVRLLSQLELERSLLDGRAPSRAELTVRRHHLREFEQADDLPRRFEMPMRVELHSTTLAGAIRGWAASPGRYEGRAVVLDTPSAARLRPGDVIVTTSTDASWAPLFETAGALVIERGGPLSHASILARELGVPAVVNLPGIVDQMRRAGDVRIAVDGSLGVVHVIDDAPPAVRTETSVPVVPVRTPPEAPDPNRTSVFVTGLIGAGALLSAVITATEAISSASARRRLDRRAADRARRTAQMVVDGPDAAMTSPIGLARPRAYAIASILTAALAALAAVGLVWGHTESRDGLVVRVAVAAMTAVTLAWPTWWFARAARRWPDVPTAVRRIGSWQRGPTLVDRWWSAVPALHRRGIVGAVAIAGVLLVLAAASESLLLRLDEPLYDAIDAGRDAPLWQPDWLDRWFGRPQVIVPAALVVALFTIRCRVLALAYPLAIVFGGVLNLGLGELVGRQRPPLSEHADQFDSFPSGSAIEAVLLFGLVPLAVAVLLESPLAGRVVRVAATIVLLVIVADGLRSGSHWPSDWVAGVAMAMIAVIYVHGIVRTPIVHDRCSDCPAERLARRDGHGMTDHDPPDHS